MPCVAREHWRCRPISNAPRARPMTMRRTTKRCSPARMALWPRPPPQFSLTEQQQAQALVAAVDAGGLPLNAARVNQIARQLGLEVSTRAPVEQTIERIRAALARQSG